MYVYTVPMHSQTLHRLPYLRASFNLLENTLMKTDVGFIFCPVINNVNIEVIPIRKPEFIIGLNLKR
jgi:hypothetical protein